MIQKPFSPSVCFTITQTLRAQNLTWEKPEDEATQLSLPCSTIALAEWRRGSDLNFIYGKANNIIITTVRLGFLQASRPNLLKVFSLVFQEKSHSWFGFYLNLSFGASVSLYKVSSVTESHRRVHTDHSVISRGKPAERSPCRSANQSQANTHTD